MFQGSFFINSRPCAQFHMDWHMACHINMFTNGMQMSKQN